MTVRSGWHYNSPAQNPGQTRQDTRLVPIGTMTPIDAMTTRSGVIPGGTGLLLTGTGMTGTIAVGRAVIQGTAAQGAYPFAVTAAETFVVANGHASLVRIDSVFAVAYDQLYDTSGQTLAAIVYVQGTPGSGTAPTAPATGTAYLKLWDISVAAGASAGSPINWGTSLTDQRPYTVAVGGINPGGSSVAGSFAGQWRDGGGTSGILERYSGSSWEGAVRLGNSGQVALGDVALTRSATATMQVGGGLVVTGAFSAGGIGGVQNIYKFNTQTVTSSTSLTNDADLSFAVVANARYVFDGYLAYIGETFGLGPADLKADWTIPAGADFAWARHGYPSNSTAQTDTVQTDNATIRVLGTFGTATTLTARFAGRVATVGTAGVCQLRWAQNVSCATPLTMRAGSWIRVTRVA